MKAVWTTIILVVILVLGVLALCGTFGVRNDIPEKLELNPDSTVLVEETKPEQVLVEEIIVENEGFDKENNLHYCKWVWVG